MEKQCQKCKVIFDLRMFYRNHFSLCKKCSNKQSIEWQKNNKERAAFLNKRTREQNKLLAIEKYSNGENKCACCGENEIKFLSIDHIKGGGNKHRKTTGGTGQMTYRWLKRNNYPDGFQVLCFNCNIAKGCYNECPHKNYKS